MIVCVLRRIEDPSAHDEIETCLDFGIWRDRLYLNLQVEGAALKVQVRTRNLPFSTSLESENFATLSVLPQSVKGHPNGGYRLWNIGKAEQPLYVQTYIGVICKAEHGTLRRTMLRLPQVRREAQYYLYGDDRATVCDTLVVVDREAATHRGGVIPAAHPFSKNDSGVIGILREQEAVLVRLVDGRSYTVNLQTAELQMASEAQIAKAEATAAERRSRTASRRQGLKVTVKEISNSRA